jgi:hypothetical protein
MAKTKRKKLTEKICELMKQICRERDSYTCQKCGKKVSGQDAHTAHIRSKGVGGLRFKFDLLDVILLCFHCHQMQHAGEWNAMDWLVERYPHRAEYLEYLKTLPPAKYKDKDLEDMIERYKGILKGLTPLPDENVC